MLKKGVEATSTLVEMMHRQMRSLVKEAKDYQATKDEWDKARKEDEKTVEQGGQHRHVVDHGFARGGGRGHGDMLAL